MKKRISWPKPQSHTRSVFLSLKFFEFQLSLSLSVYLQFFRSPHCPQPLSPQNIFSSQVPLACSLRLKFFELQIFLSFLFSNFSNLNRLLLSFLNLPNWSYCHGNAVTKIFTRPKSLSLSLSNFSKPQLPLVFFLSYIFPGPNFTSLSSSLQNHSRNRTSSSSFSCIFRVQSAFYFLFPFLLSSLSL